MFVSFVIDAYSLSIKGENGPEGPTGSPGIKGDKVKLFFYFTSFIHLSGFYPFFVCQKMLYRRLKSSEKIIVNDSSIDCFPFTFVP